MKIEVQKAEAFVIEKGKHYLVTFESSRPPEDMDVTNIKNQMELLFSKFGAKVVVAVTFEGRINISELPK